MDIDKVERIARRAAGFGSVVFLGVIFAGLYRASRHAKGRHSGNPPAIVKGFGRGDPWFYVPVSALAFGLLYLLWRPVPLKLSPGARVAAMILGSLLFFQGLALMLWGRATLADMYNVSTSMSAELYADHRLVTNGPFNYFRHPMYVGGQMAELGLLLLFRNWATIIIALNILVLMRRAAREEEALAAEFGQSWLEYKAKTRAGILVLGG